MPHYFDYIHLINCVQLVNELGFVSPISVEKVQDYREVIKNFVSGSPGSVVFAERLVDELDRIQNKMSDMILEEMGY
jgi:hypothetical protein